MRVKEENEKVGLKLNIQKTKIMVSCPINGEKVEIVTDFLGEDSKISRMVTIAMKLKDTYSLEEKLWPT